MAGRQENIPGKTGLEIYDPLIRQLQKLGHPGFAKLIRGMLHTLAKSTKNETVFASALFETGTFLNQPMDEIIAQGKFEFIATTYNLVINKFQVRALIKALAISENTQVIQLISRELEKKLQRDEAAMGGAPSITISYHGSNSNDDPDSKPISSHVGETRMHVHLGHTYSCPIEGTETEPLLPHEPPKRPTWEKRAMVILGMIIVGTIVVAVLILVFPKEQIDPTLPYTNNTDDSTSTSSYYDY